MLPHLGADQLNELLSFPRAIAALRNALRDGPPDVTAPARTAVDAPGGHVLLMPAADQDLFGIKIAGVAPGNPALGLPHITGTYLLHDGATLQPLLAIDGPALTLLRTAALSALAIDLLAPPDAARLLIYGTGPQAAAHLHALGAVRDFTTVSVAGRTAQSTRRFADAHGIGVATPDDLGRADVVACCTSATSPLFDGRHLARRATVVAMGSHTLDARELDTHTLLGAQVVVEDVATATREAADVAEALASGDLTEAVPLHRLVTGQVSAHHDRRRVFRSVGMAWEDLTIAKEALNRRRAARGG